MDRWPGFRGRNGSGVAPGGSPAVKFSAIEGFRWKTEVPGEGNSSPVVWDDFIFLTSALEDSDPAKLAILAFSRSDGRQLWQLEVGHPQGRTHGKNGYASATVITDGQRVFAFFGTTGLFACDYSGELLWSAELGDLGHMWGTAASPVLFDDLVIQLCDSQKNSYIAAFDKQTGERVWKTDRPGRACWSTPVVIEADRDGNPRAELVVNGSGGNNSDARLVIAYDPADGQELWRVRGTTELVSPTPMIGAGLVYCTSGRNGPTFAIRPGGDGDVTDTRVVWKLNRGGPYIPSGVFYRNRLYLVRDATHLSCYDAGDGRQIWSTRLRGMFTASLVAADGKVYATSERGKVYVFAASDSYELLGKNEMGARCLATPAIAGGELFIRTRNHLYCVPAGD